MNHFVVLTHKLSDLSLTDKESDLDKEIGKSHLVISSCGKTRKNREQEDTSKLQGDLFLP